MKSIIFAVALTSVAHAIPIYPPANYSTSEVCKFDVCDQSPTTPGDPAVSNISRTYATTDAENVGARGSMAISQGSWAGYSGIGGYVSFSGLGVVSYSATAYGTWFDNLMIGSGSLLVLPIHITGNVDIGYVAPARLPDGGRISAGVQVGSFCAANDYDGTNYRPPSYCSGPGLTFTSSQTVDEIIELSIPFTPNQLFTLQYSPTVQSTFAFSGGSFDGGPFLATFHANGAFDHTAILQAARVYDLQGNLIPDAQIISQAGFDFRNPSGGPSEVPEPGTVLLAATALSMLFAARRAKRIT